MKYDILHINSYYVSRNLYKNIYDHQVGIGKSIKVFVPVRANRIPVDFERGEYTDLSFDFLKIDRYFFHIKHKKIYEDLKHKYEKYEFSAVHAHSLFSNGYVAYKYKKVYGTKYIVTVQNTDINDFYRKLFFLRHIGTTVLLEAEAVIFASDPYRTYLIENYVPDKYKKEVMQKSYVIPYGIDAFWLSNKYTDRVFPKGEELHLICVGEINKNKNQLSTVKVCEELIHRGHRVKLTLIGKVVDKEIYDQIAKIPYVEYYEFMPKEQLISHYRDNDIFIMPSFTETFGLVYAEALTQGLPIIYTKGQGFDQQFPSGKVGYEVLPTDISGMASAVEKVIKDYDSMSQNAITLVDKFDWNVIGKQYDHIMNSIGIANRRNID